jgi:hypothetical protein
MPTISQLPSAGTVTAGDAIPISQSGAVRATSVGALLSATQPAILIASPSLLGRTSIGTGSPEQIGIGSGVTLAAGTLVANGLDHAAFPAAQSLPPAAALVATTRGGPVLIPAPLLRGLFAAGTNVTIDSNGTISANGTVASAATPISAATIGALPAVASPAAGDLLPISHAGTMAAVSYANLLGGVTIDQAQAAGPAGDADTIWVAQGSNVMASQSFGAIWSWLTGKFPGYKTPVAEITANTNLDATVHNGRILICSQPVTLSPQLTNMGSGFACHLINASSGNVILTNGFVTSTGTYSLTPWQSATILCIAYSGGTVAYAVMPGTASGTNQATSLLPAQVAGLAGAAAGSTSVQLTWTQQTGSNAATSYTVQYRLSGAASWNSAQSGITSAAATIGGLQPATSYDFSVVPLNAAGSGAVSATVTVTTPAAAGSVTSITWNLVPSGTYTHGNGAVGVNAHVSPANAAIQFGFSASATVRPAQWTAAVLVNSDLWGQYLAIPASAGTYYTWASGTDGSASTVSSTTFTVQ